MTAVAGSRLPGLLGHELRNPLASAMTGAMLARDMVDADDPRAAVLDGVLRDLDRMTCLIDGWLAMARGSGTGSSSGDTRLLVADLLDHAVRRHRAELVCCPDDAAVRGNRVLLERVLDNLCENARNAGAAAIRIAAQQSGAAVSIHVEDDGDGIAPDDVERIFAPGWSRGGGTGLGLFAAATTLAAHRGSVRCQPLLRGTRFTITLPLYDEGS
jgi:signal transduction histidine kinase